MPELPEVETVCRGLNKLTLAKEILGGDVLLPRTIAYPLSVVEFLAGLQGTVFTHWHRRGKYLLAELVEATDKSTPAGWLGVHLRMTGQLLWLAPDSPRCRTGEAREAEKNKQGVIEADLVSNEINAQEQLQKHTRVRLFFQDAQELRFVDQRTFGKMWWVPAGMPLEEAIAGLKILGPDPHSDRFTVEYMAAQLQRRHRAIKTALLDQSFVAGLGNIYADEALFLSGIRPTTLCINLSKVQIDRLRTAILQVLQTAINAGGTTFSNFLNVQGVNGNYGGVAWVYNRTGEFCRVCSTPIERMKLTGRSAHFCPQCQT